MLSAKAGCGEVGVRKTISDHPAIFGSIGGALCLVMVFVLFWERTGAKCTVLAKYGNKAFFSDDGGLTWFIDDDTNLSPFDHGGKQAYQAKLFRCGRDKPFLAYIEKVPDAILKPVAAERAAQAQRDPSRPPNAVPPPGIAMDVKKPGDSQWLSAAAATGSKEAVEYRQILTPQCPDGSAASVVLPADADAH